VLSDGWPIGLTKKGEERLLQGWAVVKTGEMKRMIRACIRCGKQVFKDRGSKAWTCRQCGKIEWFDYEHKETSTVRWRLRFGWIQIAVSEFGYNKQTGSPNYNYHLHTAFFGPFLPWARLMELFREESLKALGIESRGVVIAPACDGFRSVLAHALKYTEKIPASTPSGRAQYEIVLNGVRRFAVSGLLQGVPLPKAVEKKDCSECNSPMEKTLRMIPLSELADLPILLESKKESPTLARRDDCGKYFLDFVTDGQNRARAPC
jgi:ribosomal protein S27AE